MQSLEYANQNYIICNNNNNHKIFSRFAAVIICSVGWWQGAGSHSCCIKLGHPPGSDLDRKGTGGHITDCCSQCLVVYIMFSG